MRADLWVARTVEPKAVAKAHLRAVQLAVQLAGLWVDS